ncbi:MAG: F0F1 ATP synthase subunit B [Clostridia bacterium]|nr:F0F1 ATP synthase subunit B [Clostridia bacterium]
MQSSDIVSFNIWQVIISLLNLLILFLILKKFLYKPVKKVLEERQSMLDEHFSNAENAEKSAKKAQKTYEEKLAGANTEAAEILKAANKKAERRSDKIVASAKQKADDIVRQAQSDAKLEKQKAQSEIKHEITEVSTMLTEKLLEREIQSADHRDFINSFIEKIGDDND